MVSLQGREFHPERFAADCAASLRPPPALHRFRYPGYEGDIILGSGKSGIMRAFRFLATCLMLALAVPAAMPAMAAPETRGAGEARRLYASLVDRDAAAVLRFVAGVATRAGFPCIAAREWQVIGDGPGWQTMKLVCDDKPPVVMTVDVRGGVLLSAAEGRIRPVDPEEGTVVTAPAGGNRHLLGLMLVQGGLLAVLILIVGISAWRGHRRVLAMGTLDSAGKNRLIAGGRLVYPNVWRNDEAGIYIAKGPRGRRRLYGSFLPAFLYRSMGIKFGRD